MYAASACLVLVMIIMGVSMINSFDRMKSVQNTLDTLTGKTDTVETRETSGAVTAVTAEQPGEAEDKEGQAGDTLETDTGDKEQPEDIQAAGSGDSAQETRAETRSGTEMDSAGSQNEQVVSSEGENGSDGVYIVEEGDTLAIISRKMYGDVTHVDAICKMNGITDGNLIYVGQKLLLP